MALTIVQIRNMVSDLGTPPLLVDDQYQTIIDTGETNLYRAAAVACRQLAALFGSRASLKAGPASLSNSDKSVAYRELAGYYDKLADDGYGDDGSGTPAVGQFGVLLTGVSRTEMADVASNSDRPPSKFTIGMDDNLRSTD